MASSYTTHYNLDKYVGTDKPNLRDQYNAAMDKIDVELWSQHSDAADAKAAATSASNAVTALSGRVTQNEGDISTLKGIIPATSFSSTNTVKKYIDDTVIAKLKQGTYAIIIGNSWIAPSGQSDPGYGNVLKSWMANLCGASIECFGRGSAGWLATGQQSGQTIAAAVDEAIAHAATDDRVCTDVFFLEMQNDQSYFTQQNPSNYVNIVKTNVNKIRTAIPNAKIHYIVDNAPSCNKKASHTATILWSRYEMLSCIQIVLLVLLNLARKLNKLLFWHPLANLNHVRACNQNVVVVDALCNHAAQLARSCLTKNHHRLRVLVLHVVVSNNCLVECRCHGVMSVGLVVLAQLRVNIERFGVKRVGVLLGALVYLLANNHEIVGLECLYKLALCGAYAFAACKLV